MIIRTDPRVRWSANPRPDESLLGLMVSTAEENLHPDIGNILSFAGMPSTNGIGQSMLDPEKRRKLAYVLDQPLEVVETRAHGPAGFINGMAAIDFFGARVPAFDVLHDRRRVGSTSDKAGFYHRAIWQLIHVPACIVSETPIVDRCASCGAKLGWRYAPHSWSCFKDHVMRARNSGEETSSVYDCSARGSGANDAPAPMVKNVIAAIGPMLALMDPRPAVHQAARDALHPDLRAIDRGIVFYLGMKLGRALAFEGKGARVRCAAAAPYEEGIAALATGATILQNWPDGVARLIAEKAEDGHGRAMAAVSAMRRVCYGPRAWPEHLEIVRAAMPAIVSGHYQQVVRRVADDAIDGRTAMGIMGIRASDMARLTRSPALEPLIARGTVKTHGSFAKSDVERIAMAIANSVEAARVVEETGIPLHGVEQLVCGGMLTHASHPAVLALFRNLRVTLSSYEKLIADLKAGLSDFSSDPPMVLLRHAVLRIGGREKPWWGIVRALLDGDVRYRFAKSTGRLIDRIAVEDGPGLEQALAKVFDRKVHPCFPFAATMRQRDAIELMNIDPRRWQKVLGFLPTDMPAENNSVDVAAALQLAAEVIDKREAKARWGVRLSRHELIREGLGWDRAEIERKCATHAR